MGQPFIGHTGHLLKSCLSASDVLYSGCFAGYVSQTRAPADQPARLSWDGWQIQSGLQKLKRDIGVFDPNIVVLLGATALKAAGMGHKKIHDMRGTLFTCMDLDSPFYGRKCLATLHPSAIIVKYDLLPLFRFDLSRARKEGDDPKLELPERHYELDLTGPEIVDRLDNWPKGQWASLDIEGGIPQNITCLAISGDPLSAFVIDYKGMGDDYKPMVFDAVHRFLADPEIPKVLQHSLYDNFCLAWKHHSPIANVAWDTMLSGWEIFPELPKSLGVQASIWTKQPFYKSDRKIDDHRTHLAYNCTDAAVTLEIALAHAEAMADDELALRHFEFNMALLPAFMYMQLKGFNYDKEGASEREKELIVEMSEIQYDIDRLSGTSLNCNSSKQLMSVLYDTLGFPVQYNKKKVNGRMVSTPTADTPALLRLFKKFNSDILYAILIWKARESERRQVATDTDSDGRLRGNYNVVGTETGRLTCNKSNTGNGPPLQGVMKPVRRFYQADPDNYVCQIDLSGADGLTVAAYAKKLQDPTMMDDYSYGVKPAKVICAMRLTGDSSIAKLPAHEVADIIDSVDIPVWLYNAAKAVQHGSSYGMGKPTMSQNIMNQSWKHMGEVVHVTPADCGKLQDLFFLRYPGVLRWQSWVKSQLTQNSYLDDASGHRRHFFGRRNDNSTLQSAYAHEPQSNTTYATNLALSNLWQDPDNRCSKGTSLIIQPLHQVHDAVICQFPRARTDWAVSKLKSYFDNELTIAGQRFIIPYEGEYGEYWGDDSGGTIQS